MTSLKHWLIRGLILLCFAVAGWGGWVAYHWVSPETIRIAVLEHLQEELGPDVQIELHSANMRLFGGLSLQDLKLTRRGESQPFLIVPSAIIAHEKAELNHGRLKIRKIEMHQPILRVNRLADDSWDLDNYIQKKSSDEILPTLMIHQGLLIVEDRSADPFPGVAIRIRQFHLINEPLPTLKCDMQGSVLASAALNDDGTIPDDVLQVPFTLAAKLNRYTFEITSHIETDEVELTTDLMGLLCQVQPDLGSVVSNFSAKVSSKVDLRFEPQSIQNWKYQVQLQFVNGRWQGEELPWPVENLNGTVMIRDGRMIVDKATARLMNADVEVSLETRAYLCESCTNPLVYWQPGPRIRPVSAIQQIASWTAASPAPDSSEDSEWDLAGLEERLQSFDITVKKLSLDDELFTRLTPKAHRLQQMFQPKGGVDVRLNFERQGSAWHREVEVIPNKLAITYEEFPYTISDLVGSLKKVTGSDGTDEFRIQLTGSASGRRIDLSGKAAGDGPDPMLAIRIVGIDVPIDQKLINALPPKYCESLTQMHARARGDFDVDIRQALGCNRCENTFRIKVYDGTIDYELFPYSLKQIRGNILIRVTAVDPDRPYRPGMVPIPVEDTDRVEFRNFEAVHDGGRLWLSGESEPVVGTVDRRLRLEIQGENCPIDEQFQAAMKDLKLERFLKVLSPRGELTFGAELELWDRAGAKPMSPQLSQPELQLVGPVAHPSSGDGLLQTSAKIPEDTPFDPIHDLKLALNFKGPSITPSFFPYDLHQLAGVVRYQMGRVDLVKFSARHGQSDIKLDAGQVFYSQEKGIWANLGGLEFSPLVPDTNFLEALPKQLKDGLKELNLRGKAELQVKQLVVQVPPSSTGPPATLGPKAPIVPLTQPQPVVPNVIRSQAPIPADRPYYPVIGAAPTVTNVLSTKPPLLAETPTGTIATPTIIEPRTLSFQSPPEASTEFPDPILYWNAALKLNGASLDAGLAWDELQGVISMEGRHEGTHLGPIIGNIWLDRATIEKQPISATKFSYRVLPQELDPNRPGQYLPPVLESRDISSTIFQGQVTGEARIVLTDPTRYRIFLAASEVRLEELAQHYKLASGAELQGKAQGQFLLENIVDPKTGQLITSGVGQIDVPQGRMYNLPVLLDLVKVLKGQVPDGCAFEEAHATFELRGDRIRVSQLDLLGSAVSLGGSGELDTSGQDVQFDFYTIWSQTLKRWLTTPLGDPSGILSGSLFKIELKRDPKSGKLEPKGHILPLVTDPVKDVADRLRRRFGSTKVQPNTQRQR